MTEGAEAGKLAKVGTKGTYRRLTLTAVQEALRRTHGQISAAARVLGVQRYSLQKFIRRHRLEEFVQAIRDEVLDEVELRLIEAALQGRAWAVMFLLKTLGRDRGYVERQEVAQASKLEIELVEVPGDPLAR